DMSAAVIEGNDAVTGHIISTTIGGKNGEPKQTISYMAERVVGTGSFGIVFQYQLRACEPSSDFQLVDFRVAYFDQSLRLRDRSTFVRVLQLPYELVPALSSLS
ncbi:hypothetical protein DY000_02030025, partial [Brassica cretica]